MQSLRRAFIDLRHSRVADETQPIHEQIEREFPELANLMTDVLYTSIEEAKPFLKEEIHVIAVQHLAMGIWIGRRAQQLEAGQRRQRKNCGGVRMAC
jgi:hypothetical protein